MSATPGPVHLDDLRHPQFSPEVRQMLDAGASLAEGLTLSLDALCAGAETDTGLHDFGDDRFRAPLGVLSAALDTEAGLSPMGRVSVHAQLSQLLRNRLLMTDLLTRHPEIRDIPVDRPIIIAGLPRTGTTHLHNLLAADPALRSLPYWEALEPVPLPGEPATADEHDPRLGRTQAGLDFLEAAMPYFKRMHEMTTWHVHEEIHLLGIAGSTMYFDTMAPMPSWRAWYRSHDQTPYYRELRTMLQILTFLRGGDRWVLKSPQHLEQFGPLSTVFPDATFIVTHRDPVRVTASMATMVAYASRLTHDPVPVETIAHYWADLLADMLGACARDRDLLPAEASIDLHFDHFIRDERAAVAHVYASADQPLDERAAAAHESYLHNHVRNRHGSVVYDLDDLGLDEDRLRTRFTDYVERFVVTQE